MNQGTVRDTTWLQRPPSTSNDVWRTGQLRRVLVTSDVLACVSTVLILLVGFARMQQQVPGNTSLHDAYLGPSRPFHHMTFAIPGYALTAVTPMLLLLSRPAAYFKHRTTVVTFIRLLRLGVQLFTMLRPAAVAPLAGIIAARAVEQPHKALLIILIQPMSFYLQHALFLLPWRRVLVLQMVSTAAMLNWCWHFPCFLQQQWQQHPHVQLPSAAEWLASAGYLCAAVQSVVATARAAVGDPLSERSVDVCSGFAAVQTLQVFSTLLVLLVAPVCLAYLLEHWAKQQQRRQQQQHEQDQDAVPRAASSRNSSLTAQQAPANHAARAATTITSSSSSNSSSSSSPDISSASTGNPTNTRAGNTAAATQYSSHHGTTGSTSHAANLATTLTAVAASATSSSTARRSDSTQGAGLARTSSGLEPQMDINSLSTADMICLVNAEIDGQVLQAGGLACTHLLVLVLLVPVMWMLAEGMAEVFLDRRDCADVLAAVAVSS